MFTLISLSRIRFLSFVKAAGTFSCANVGNSMETVTRTKYTLFQRIQLWLLELQIAVSF